MRIGLIGLGKMGYPLALNFKEKNIDIVVYSSNVEKLDKLLKQKIEGFSNLDTFINSFSDTKIIWLMIPSGEAVDDMIMTLIPKLGEGDIVIDGGNSNYRDSIKRYDLLKEKGIHFLDVGTSGGVEGARYGACLMVGGDEFIYKKLEHIFKALSGGRGCDFIGESGSGHYVKMIHNAIEYGMMQAIGEGFQIMNQSDYDIDLYKVSKIWENGSIISGLLMNTVAKALEKDKLLDDIEGKVSFSGEADWAVEEALHLKVSIPVIAASLFARYKSNDDNDFSEKILAAMRNEFGGHSIKYKKERNK